MDDSREGELMDCDGKSESIPEWEAVDDETKGVEGTDDVKKRKRKPYRPGIGGFMVRQRSRTGQGKTKRSVIRKDSSGSISEQLPCKDDGGHTGTESEIGGKENPLKFENVCLRGDFDLSFGSCTL
nr:histone-lysine N-methyltransferase 2C-like [Pongo pygmaeus]